MSSQGQQGGGSSSSSSYYYGSGGGGQQQQQQQQQQRPPPQDPEWRCLKCGQYISSIRSEAEAHNRICNGRCIWVCKYCRAEFEDSTVAEQHIYQHWNQMGTGGQNQNTWGN